MTRRVVDVLFVILDVRITLDNAPVLQTQVGNQILALKRLGLRPGLLCTVEDPDRFRKVIGQSLDDARVPVWTVVHHGLAANLIGIARALRAACAEADVRNAYARTIWAALVVRVAAPGALPYVYDVRGALSEETVDQGSAAWKAHVYTYLERKAVQRARHVSTVSTGLAAEVRRRYGAAGVGVIPSCVDIRPLPDDTLATARRAAGFPEDALVLAYSGGLNYYQPVPEMLALWELMLDDPRVFFLLLTNKTPHILERPFDLTRFGDRLVHRSVPQSQVHEMLMLADVGFLLRKHMPLNAVASPVKAAEYLMAGLALAISPGIGDASARVEAEDLGVLIPAGEPSAGAEPLRRLLRAVTTDRSGYRRRAREAAVSYYDWSAYAPVFQRLYGPSTQ